MKERLQELVDKWRASANGHIRRGRGETRRDHAVKALAQGGIYRLCANELDSALKDDNNEAKPTPP